MSKDLKIFNDSYFMDWLKIIKQRIKQSQLKAAVWQLRNSSQGRQQSQYLILIRPRNPRKLNRWSRPSMMGLAI